ncbi:iron ABC transporter permease [Clostridioides difficile]|nr:iron ABC transporter permease [Clostridioides difficile]
MTTISKKNMTYSLILISIVVLVFGIVLSITIGAKDMNLSTVISSLINIEDGINMRIVKDVRLPRAIAAALVGGFLAVSGAIMQGITRNPIAEPSIIGITQGATFAIAISLVLQQKLPKLIHGSFSVMMFAFIGASISGLFIYFISSKSRGRVNNVKLALAGVALGTLLISLASAISMYFNLSQQLSFWISGGLVGITWESIKLLFIVGGIGFILSMIMAPRITILSLGEEVAIGLGQKTDIVRFICIVLVILMTGASVSVSGNIIFIGLIIPQIAKGIVGSDYKYIIPSSLVLGAVLLVYTDILGRMINPPYETPVGSITALIGVPIFIYLVRKGNK